MSMTNILLVCANPRSTDRVRTDQEDRTLRESLRLSPNRNTFDVQTLNAASIDDLRHALLWKQFDIVHFSGHGTHSGLVFEDAEGKLMVPESAALAELLHRRKVRVALLNACYSLSVGRIAAIGLDYTIASTGPISDPGAIEFTRGFYDALGAGLDVPDAYAEGMSAAQLKDLKIDAILLKKEAVFSSSSVVPRMLERSVRSDAVRTLLGISIDVSGSMQNSMRNQEGGVSTRFTEVKSALADIGAQVHDELRMGSSTIDDTFDVFLYAFGLRVGSGVADLPALWAAAQSVDIEREVAVRRMQYETKAHQEASQYASLASLARSVGYGDIVDSLTNAATESIRKKIVEDIASMILAEAGRSGDKMLKAGELGALFNKLPDSQDTRLLEHLLFGETPMLAALKEIRDRFRRSGTDGYGYRTLLIISDGESTDGDPLPVIKELLASGIDVIACFVTDDDVADPRTLHGSPSPKWTAAARLMWESASPVDESGSAARLLLSNGWSIERNARLFVQVNHSAILKEFARVAASLSTHQTSSLLPRGG